MRHYTRTSQRGSWSKQAMIKAITACLAGEFGYLSASKKFHVPRSTLKYRVDKTKRGITIARAAEKSLNRYNTVFTAQQEKDLISYVLEMEERRYELTPISLRRLAYRFAQEIKVKHNFSNKTEAAGTDWLYGFMRRHPDMPFFMTKHFKTPKWSEEAIALLIDLYRENACLYDTDCKAYYDKQERAKVIENIVEQLQEVRPDTVDTEVRSKLEGLRTTYISIVRALTAFHNADDAIKIDLYDSSLYFYKCLSFFGDYVEPYQDEKKPEIASTIILSEIVGDYVEPYQNEKKPEIASTIILSETDEIVELPEGTEIKIEEVEEEIIIDNSNNTIIEFEEPDIIPLEELNAIFLKSQGLPSLAPKSVTELRPSNPRQYLSPKQKRAMDFDPLEIPPADGLNQESSEVQSLNLVNAQDSVKSFLPTPILKNQLTSSHHIKSTEGINQLTSSQSVDDASKYVHRYNPASIKLLNFSQTVEGEGSARCFNLPKPATVTDSVKQFLSRKLKFGSNSVSNSASDESESADFSVSSTLDHKEESLNQFLSYIGTRMNRISSKDILQELEDQILLKIMEAEDKERKRKRVQSC